MQGSILEKPALIPQNLGLFLTPPGFRGKIESAYNKDTLTECSRCEDATL